MKDVPYYSQWADDVPEEWKRRACGVTALRMALGGVVGTSPRAKEVIEEGVAKGAYIKGIGWKHDGLVALATAHGATAYRREYRAKGNPLLAWWRTQQGLRDLMVALHRGAVPIVSLTVEGSKDTHLVPLIGVKEGSGFFYHEPAAHGTDGAHKFITTRDFLSRWRRLVIFVGPNR